MIMYNVRDIVQIKQGTEYYRNSSAHNPKNMDGIISNFEEDPVYCYRVKWVNGEENVYRESDLVLARKKDDSTETLEKENKELKELVAKLQKEKKELENEFDNLLTSIEKSHCEVKEQPKRKMLF